MARYFEQKIVKQVLKDAVKGGYQLVVDDGEEEFPPTTNIKEAYDNLFGVDESRLILEKDGNYVGWIFFVFGNDGWDVISDYTVNLEEFLTNANKLADKFENGE
jgi:hypothetical protein